MIFNAIVSTGANPPENQSVRGKTSFRRDTLLSVVLLSFPVKRFLQSFFIKSDPTKAKHRFAAISRFSLFYFLFP